MTRAKGGIFFLLMLIGTDNWWEWERQRKWIKSVRIRLCFSTHTNPRMEKKRSEFWLKWSNRKRTFVRWFTRYDSCMYILINAPRQHTYSSCVHPMNWLLFSFHLLAHCSPSFPFTHRLEKWPTCYSHRVYAGKMYIYRCDMFRSRSVVN